MQVDQIGANGTTLLARANHYFYGAASGSLLGGGDPYGYPDWREGREYQTDALNTDGSTVLRRVQQTWEQRAPVNWWTLSPDWAPPNDPRITETVNTLVDTNQVTKQIYAYDDSVPYNNRSDVYEYDYGTGAPGALVRRAHTDYMVTASYIGATTGAHLRS